ncbi:MAG: SDR family oxidoreductase [Bryobacterales bacterium]|nr:SDR family oxidoreductase [Bryobacterales bacterium]
MPSTRISVADTLRDHEVLITGANGFVGKVVLALLLDHFSDFKHLHILMRGKRGVSPRERFEKDVLSAPCLKPVVARTDPAVLTDKITLHTGDVSAPNCGFSDETIAMMKGRVSLIVNIAGLVEFTPPVDESFRSNVDGAESVLSVAKTLDAGLVHVSTCFVCGESEGLVEEDEPIVGYYPRRKGQSDNAFRARDEVDYMRARIREIRGTAMTPDKETKQKLTDLGVQRAKQWGWVNTYTYTKSLGEQLIASEPGLRYTIVRPAIVEAALELPFPGWVEGGRTAAPLVMMAMQGLRHWPVREDAPMEVVPVDQVAAAIIMAGVLLLNGESAEVYQLATADRNPVYFGQIIRWINHEYIKDNKKLRIFNPGVVVMSPEVAKSRGAMVSRKLATIYEFLTDVRQFAQQKKLPGAKRLAKLGNNIRMITRQLSIREAALELYQPFLYDNRFIFESENIRAGHARLSEDEQKKLPWWPERIRWRQYWTVNELRGIQKWVEGESTKAYSFKL